MAVLSIELPDFLRASDGEVRLVGHRITLFDIVMRYNEGYSVEMLAAYFPTLSLATIHKLLGFYLENRQAVDDYVTQYDRELDEQEARHPTQITTQMLRERLEQMREPANRH